VANLIQNPQTIEAETFNGSTPLFFAIKFNNPVAMKALISRGANIEHRNNNDLSVLGFAIEQGSLESVKILVDAGVDTKAPCDDGLNGYRLALGYGKKEMADYIRYKR
jgi:ankyrin repeat protein